MPITSVTLSDGNEPVERADQPACVPYWLRAMFGPRVLFALVDRRPRVHPMMTEQVTYCRRMSSLAWLAWPATMS